MFSSKAAQYYRQTGQGGSEARALPPPQTRRLRGYAFDPSLSIRLETAAINQATFEVPWELELKPGPVGEYIEVLDYDPASACWYEPVDLNAIEVVAQDGLSPSQGNPQFHQQMVYAVAMRTISSFENALGRQVFWSSRYEEKLPSGERDGYVQRLRLYPHALRAANAYYSPTKRAILFGYFPGSCGTVFSCLSHDIIAHEVTHALLDGMNRRYIEDNHEDSLAFHEAFADLVALFEHFTFPEVLRHQIAQTRGDLESQSLLGELAMEFGEATGRYGALRSAIGKRDEHGKWRPIEPDPTALAREFEPHARGAILVAAVFGAFVAANRRRVSDLIRLATAGTGVLPAGAIHPDLVQRLAEDTCKTANHFLAMCIRALDYCPPVDMTFGDYLRALITADFDMTLDDPHGYRVALIESFRRWSILPSGLRALSEEQLRWPFVKWNDPDGYKALADIACQVRTEIADTLFIQDRRQLFEKLKAARASTREALRKRLQGSTAFKDSLELSRVTGLNLAERETRAGGAGGEASSFEVHALRPALRMGPDGTIHKQLVMILTQRKRLPRYPDQPELGSFDFRGGSTLIFDLEGETPSLRYAITRPIDDDQRLERMRAYWKRSEEEGLSLRAMYFGSADDEDEPLCLLHGGG